MRKVLLILVFIVPISLFCQQVNTIAVMELDAVGISSNEAKIISARLRTDLFNTQKYIVLERDKMEEILNEQGLQLSGCTTNECIVEAGKLLGVRQIVAGDIGKLGNLFTLTIRIIDIQTGKILQTATEDCNCSIEDVLTYSVKNVAQILSGKELLSKNYNSTKLKSKDWKNYGLTLSEYESFNKSGLKIEEWKPNFNAYNEGKINPILNTLFSGAIPGLGQSRIGSLRAYLYYSAEIVAILYGIGFFGTDANITDIGTLIAVVNHSISALDAGISTVYYNIDLEKQYKLVNNLKINSKISLFSFSINF